MSPVQVDEHDVPLTKLVVRDAEVLWNPFDDLQPRVDKEDKKAAKAEAEAVLKHRSVSIFSSKAESSWSDYLSVSGSQGFLHRLVASGEVLLQQFCPDRKSVV